MFGVDITTDLFENIKPLVGLGGVEVFINIEQVKEKVDYVYMWHVLEHLINPKEVLQKINKISNSGCCLAIQIPQYKKNYICEVHHYFYTEKSLEQLLKKSGFKIEKIVYDITNEFMTVMALKE